MIKYNGIQCLRAFAVLLVMWAHLKFAADFSGIHWIKTAAGAVGVDIFFVISGFVIAISAQRLKFDAKKFMINRFARVAPIYWLFSMPFVANLLLYDVINWPSIVNTFIYIPLFDNTTFTNPAHDYGWTLSFEMFFYIAFALLMCVFKSRALIGLLVLLMVGTFLTYLTSDLLPYVFKFIFHPFVLEFALGIVVYKTSKHFTKPYVVCAALTSIVFGFCVLQTQSLGYHNAILNSFPLAFERLYIWGGFGVSLLVFIVSLEKNYEITWPNGLLVLGNASYSIYLIQPYCMKLSNFVLKSGASNPLAGLVFIISVLVFGVLISKAIEYPLTRYVKHWLYRCFSIAVK